MAHTSPYTEKLRDPRWQRRRLELLQKADFKCVECDSGEKELHIHHHYYLRGRDPWDYPDELQSVLCRDCHEVAEVDRQNLLSMYFVLAHKEREEVNSIVSWYCGHLDRDEAYGSGEYRSAIDGLRQALDRWFDAQKADDET